MATFDVTAAARVLSHASMALAPRALVCDLLAPLFEEIGARWERGELSIAHEHAASQLLRTELGALLRNSANQPSERTLVAATLPGEQHEFGALLASLLAAAHGFRVVYLGANLPVADIGRAVRDAGARLVLISVVNQLDESGLAELTTLREGLPRGTTLCVGGRGALSGKKGLATSRIRHFDSLEELESLFTA